MPKEHVFSRPLGDAVKTARDKARLTQNELASLAGVDVRTVLNIENYHGNPKMEVIYPLIRALRMDPYNVFFSEISSPKSPSQQQLYALASTCTDAEATALLSICDAVLSALRAKDSMDA